jgi:hypothetical protein
MQFNLIDEVFELPTARRARWHSSAAKPT